MAERVIPYYIDFKSPYAFLSVGPARALEVEYGVTLDWRPYNLPIADYLGDLDDRNSHQWRRVRYSYMDCRRLANQRGMTIRGTRKVYDSTVSGIGMLYARRAGLLGAYVDAVFERLFRRELEIDDPEAIAGVLAEFGADPELVAAWFAGPGPAAFAAVMEEAHARGVFGVPSFIHEDELFWGNERIELLKERLRTTAAREREVAPAR